MVRRQFLQTIIFLTHWWPTFWPSVRAHAGAKHAPRWGCRRPLGPFPGAETSKSGGRGGGLSVPDFELRSPSYGPICLICLGLFLAIVRRCGRFMLGAFWALLSDVSWGEPETKPIKSVR